MSAQNFLWAGAASKTQGAAGTGTSDIFQPHVELDVACIFTLKVTSAAAVAGDTLDVWLEHSWDDGTTFDDFVHFTQVLGNGGALTHLAQWLLYGGAPTAQLHKAVTKTLAVGVNQGPLGNQWRAEYTVAGASAAFTFQIQVEQFDE